MANRADGLIVDSLIHSWSATNNTAAGNTCVASSGVLGNAKNVMTQLGWSIRNATAAAFTATLSVRDASIAGTVLATWDIVVANAGGQQDSFAVNLQSTKGNAVVAEFGTPAASVTQKVSIAGWRNQSDNV